MSTTSASDCSAAAAEIVAGHLDQGLVLDAANPSPLWSGAEPITFCRDWRGENSDPERETRVKLLWSKEFLYLRFECRYRELSFFEDCEPNGWRDRLWERDVAEVFLQPDLSHHEIYKEIEVSPNGMWIDLNISRGCRSDLNSGLTRSVSQDAVRRMWTAELALPMQSLVHDFDPTVVWRANFFRIEGASGRRTYQAWQPTMTARPDFHVPEAFGQLRFAPR